MFYFENCKCFQFHVTRFYKMFGLIWRIQKSITKYWNTYWTVNFTWNECISIDQTYSLLLLHNVKNSQTTRPMKSITLISACIWKINLYSLQVVHCMTKRSTFEISRNKTKLHFSTQFHVFAGYRKPVVVNKFFGFVVSFDNCLFPYFWIYKYSMQMYYNVICCLRFRPY